MMCPWQPAYSDPVGRGAGVVALALVIAMAGVATPAWAQNVDAPGRYGQISLQGDFQPDPHVVQVEAGGSDSASGLGTGCAGFITNAQPDYKLEYSSPSTYPLGFFVVGDVDTTLVINDPSGRWYCNDDFSETTGQNPGVLFEQPSSGFYRVWVGAYVAQDSGQTARLSVTERGAPGGGATSSERASPGGDGTRLVSSGTGFLVSGTGHVLTNHHVIDGCTRATFQIRGDLAVAAAVLSSNAITDLALLKTSLMPSASAQFRGGAAVRLGDEVIVYGFPLLGDLSSQGNLTDGIISALSGLGDDLTRMQMTAQIQPGNSGGPVMDRGGQIVGVVVETANDEYFRRERGAVPQNVNFAIRDSLARSFLDTNNVAYGVAPANADTLTVADIAERAQAFTGIVLCYQ